MRCSRRAARPIRTPLAAERSVLQTPGKHDGSIVTDERIDSTRREPEVDDSPKSPFPVPPALWEPHGPPAHRRYFLSALTILMVVGLTFLLLGGEERLFSTSPQPVTVTIASRDGVLPDDAAPPTYRYSVTLPDGATAKYWSDHVYTVGDVVTLMRSRGRLTHRMLLMEPHRDDARK